MKKERNITARLKNKPLALWKQLIKHVRSTGQHYSLTKAADDGA